MVLRVFSIDYQNHSSMAVEWVNSVGEKFGVEIHGSARQRIIAAVLNNYPMKIALHERLGPVIEVYAGGNEERLFKAILNLSDLKKPINTRSHEYAELMANPTLEGLERFTAIMKMLE